MQKAERLSEREKAYIILESLDDAMMHVGGDLTEGYIKAIIGGLEKIDEMQEETRTLTEIQQIIDCVRAGIPVQIEYSKGADDLEDGIICKAKW